MAGRCRPRLPLLEEYTYVDLKLNNGFSDTDFDTANPQYGFARGTTPELRRQGRTTNENCTGGFRLLQHDAAGAGSLSARPESEVLKVVPDSALGVVVFNRLKDTSDRIEALGKNLQFRIPSSPLGFLKALAGVSEGIDEQGSMAIALFSAGEGKKPIAALFIPVSDYAQFLAPGS